MIQFQTREPIGSSTYPMPSDAIDYAKHMQQFSTQNNKDNVATIYIHIPFCDQICSFCGFNKFLSAESRKVTYINSLLKEMSLYAELPYVKNLTIGAVYLGGGTPNSLSAEQMNQILKFVRENFNLVPDCEITCEGTPQNFTEDRIAVLKDNKVERVSAGIQTVNQTIRHEHLHMENTEEEILFFIQRIKKHFSRFNLDFIYNLPGQTPDIWNHDLEVALAAGSDHLTIYPLVLLERTRFYSDYVKQGKLEAPSEKKELAFFDTTLERMNKSPFQPYTIRDWCLPGKECHYIHLNAQSNQILAFGAGSHGYLARTTYRNEQNLNKYSEMLDQSILPVDRHKICNDYELMQRFMVMGLRLFTLDMNRFSEKFDINWKDQPIIYKKVNDMVESGYLKLSGDIITHTESGHIWANNIRTYFEEVKGTSVGYTDTLGIDETGKSHYQTISRIKASADVEAHQ